jgi:hypothetical protein
MPEDYAAQLPCCADRVMAGFDPGCAALPRPSATVMTTELPRFPIGYTLGQTQTNQRAGRGASGRLRAELAPDSLKLTNLHRDGHSSDAPIFCYSQPLDFPGCVPIATEIFHSELHNATRAALPGDACLNKSVLRPIVESERGLKICR